MDQRNFERGIGITEVLVVAAVVAVLALGLATMLTNSLKAHQAVQIKDSLQNFKTLVRLTLADSGSCQRALQGAVVNGSAPVRVRDVSNPARIWFEKGTSMVPDGFTISSVTIAPHATHPDLATLHIRAQATDPQRVMGSSVYRVAIEIPMYARRLGSILQQCGAEGPGSGGLIYNCLSQGGSMMDVGNTGLSQCFTPNQASGTVVWHRRLSNIAPLQEGNPTDCHFPNSMTQNTAKSAAYCIRPNSPTAWPCCRRGFKRSRTGTTYYTMVPPVHSENTFTCYFVEPNFCFEPGKDGCDCN